MPLASPVRARETASRVNFLGLDIGGTRGRSAWYPDGVLAPGEVPAVQPAVHGLDAAIAGLAVALRTASGPSAPTAAVVAMAGVGDQATSQRLIDGVHAAGLGWPLAVVGDVVAAAAAGLGDGPGLLLWSGTGSFAIARAADGELHRVGGRGYLLGDQGSGYDLVRRAAAAVVLALDDLAPPTALTVALTDAFAAPSPARLGAVLQRLDTGQVAARLPVVFDVAANGDAVANEVLSAGLDGLLSLATAALRRAGLDWCTASLACGGGVLAPASPLSGLLHERLRALGAAPAITLDGYAAARGAARLAHDWFLRRSPLCQWVERVSL